MVGRGRLELPTSRLSSARSNQLSYRPGNTVFRLIDRTAEGMRRRRHVGFCVQSKSGMANHSRFSLERRWSSRRFPYGYLVTTSPQSWITKWWAHSRRLCYPLLLQPTPMVWRAVCTRPGNVFTAACWSAITSDSNFMDSSCRVQSELRWFFGISFTLQYCCPLSPPL